MTPCFTARRPPPENIVRHRDAWIAIDPKGVIGECAYDVGSMLRNPHSLLKKNAKEILKNRVEAFSYQFGIERERIVGWAFAQSVLVAWWEYEDKRIFDDTSLEFANMDIM